MNRTVRLLLFGIAMLGLLPAAVAVAYTMPAFGAHPLPYGEAINALAPVQRNVTNMVTAVNFDYRGIDTLGEEYMLLAAVAGTVVLLRGARGENSDAPAGTVANRPLVPRSDAMVLVGRVLLPLTLVFGAYVVLHAALTPGGGFQGGVILGSALLLLYLCEDYRTWRRMVRGPALHLIEGTGAALFALAGLAPMLWGAAFLQNILPLGPHKSLLSGGLIPVVNGGVGLAVAGGFAMLFLEFLEETREEKDTGEEKDAGGEKDTGEEAQR